MLPVIEVYSSGATFPEISGSSFGKISIILPPINQQKFISRILRDLDSMIEKSGFISSIIDHQISALFRSWFIDFDPVKAKSEGMLPYGMDEETAALFPDSFEDSELGRIPTGWNWGTLLDISNIWTGGTPKTSESSYWRGDIPWVSGSDLSSKGLFAFTCTENHLSWS